MKKQALTPTPMAVAGIPYPAREAPHGEKMGEGHVYDGSDEDEGNPRGLFIARRGGNRSLESRAAIKKGNKSPRYPGTVIDPTDQ
jgi:hypothetical protein